jgi:hypothetical protein
VPRFHFKFSDHEIRQAKHMQDTFRAIIQQMGGTALSSMPDEAAAASSGDEQFDYGLELILDGIKARIRP